MQEKVLRELVVDDDSCAVCPMGGEVSALCGSPCVFCKADITKDHAQLCSVRFFPWVAVTQTEPLFIASKYHLMA